MRGFKLALFSTPRIVVDDGDMAQLPAKLRDLWGVVGAVHEVVKRAHSPAAHLRKRDGGLRVVQAGGAE